MVWQVHGIVPPWCCTAGQMLDSKLSKCLQAREKLHSELRSKGHASLDEVFAVILEHTGSFFFITKGEPDDSIKPFFIIPIPI
jgi:uncharacterized membrane protein YcaP (DUF421 family)